MTIPRETLTAGLAMFTDRLLRTIVDTECQKANMAAHDTILQANKHMLTGWFWTTEDDDRVCILCLGLSENYYTLDEPHPPLPLHDLCRCWPRPDGPTWRELGVGVDEWGDVERPIHFEDEGVRFAKGGIKNGFQDLPEKIQVEMIGKKRFEMYKAGTLKLDDLVDKRTGKLFLLDELKGAGLPSGKIDWIDTSKMPLARGARWKELETVRGRRFMAELVEKGDSLSDATKIPEIKSLLEFATDKKFSLESSQRVFFGLGGEKFRSMKAGDTFNALGARSTTWDLNRAKTYGRDGATFEVLVPKGSQAVFSKVFDIEELMLLPGARFEVVKVMKDRTILKLLDDGSDHVRKLAALQAGLYRKAGHVEEFRQIRSAFRKNK